jgi:hypothetical protein
MNCVSLTPGAISTERLLSALSFRPSKYDEHDGYLLGEEKKGNSGIPELQYIIRNRTILFHPDFRYLGLVLRFGVDKSTNGTTDSL